MNLESLRHKVSTLQALHLGRWLLASELKAITRPFSRSGASTVELTRSTDGGTEVSLTVQGTSSRVETHISYLPATEGALYAPQIAATRSVYDHSGETAQSHEYYGDNAPEGAASKLGWLSVYAAVRSAQAIDGYRHAETVRPEPGVGDRSAAA